MKIRFKKIKFKNKLNFKPILKYLLLILVTAIIITLTLIALPLTEKVSEKVTFNLNTKDSQYWSKEYVAFVGTTDKKELQKVKEIIYRRLRNFGVERVAIYTESDNDESSRIRIIVNTTKDPDLVSQLATSRYSYKIVTRREDVDFDKEDDPYVVVFGITMILQNGITMILEQYIYQKTNLEQLMVIIDTSLYLNRGQISKLSSLNS